MEKLGHGHKRDLSFNTREAALPESKKTAVQYREEAYRFSPNPAGSSAIDRTDNQSKQQTGKKNVNNPELEETSEKLDKLQQKFLQDFHSQPRATTDIDFEKFPKLPEKVLEATNTWEEFCLEAKDNHGTFTYITHDAINAYNLLKYHNLSLSHDKIQIACKFLEHYTEMHGRDQVKKAFEAKNFLDAYDLWIIKTKSQPDNADNSSTSDSAESESPETKEKRRIENQWEKFTSIKSRGDINELMSNIRALAGEFKRFQIEASRKKGETILITGKKGHGFKDIYGEETDAIPDDAKAFDNLFQIPIDSNTFAGRAIKQEIANLKKAINEVNPEQTTSDATILQPKSPGRIESPDVSQFPDNPSFHQDTQVGETLSTKQEEERVIEQWNKFTAKKSENYIDGLIYSIRHISHDLRGRSDKAVARIGEKIHKTINSITNVDSKFPDIYGEETDPDPDPKKALDDLFSIKYLLGTTKGENVMSQNITELQEAINKNDLEGSSTSNILYDQLQQQTD